MDSKLYETCSQKNRKGRKTKTKKERKEKQTQKRKRKGRTVKKKFRCGESLIASQSERLCVCLRERAPGFADSRYGDTQMDSHNTVRWRYSRAHDSGFGNISMVFCILFLFLGEEERRISVKNLQGENIVKYYQAGTGAMHLHKLSYNESSKTVSLGYVRRLDRKKKYNNLLFNNLFACFKSGLNHFCFD